MCQNHVVDLGWTWMMSIMKYALKLLTTCVTSQHLLLCLSGNIKGFYLFIFLVANIGAIY
jgi:hypothetical protein